MPWFSPTSATPTPRFSQYDHTRGTIPSTAQIAPMSYHSPSVSPYNYRRGRAGATARSTRSVLLPWEAFSQEAISQPPSYGNASHAYAALSPYSPPPHPPPSGPDFSPPLGAASNSSHYHRGHGHQLAPARVRQPTKTFSGLGDGYYEHQPKFFVVGRVLRAIVNETAGDESTWTYNSYGEKVFSKARTYVVVRAAADFCTCIPIATYSGRGVSTPRARKSDHAIVYTGKIAPTPMEGELPRPGEQGMLPTPIRVDPDDRSMKLDQTSRIDFGKPCTIVYHWKVKNFGKVNPRSMPALLSQFSQILGAHVSIDSKGKRSEVSSEESEDGSAALLALECRAIDLQMQGKWEKEEALRLRLVHGWTKARHERHRETLRAMDALANTYRMQGKFADEVEVREAALDKRRELYGSNHDYTLATITDLAVTRRMQERQEEPPDSETDEEP